MPTDSQNPSDQETHDKNACGQHEDVPSVEKKIFVRQVILYGFLWTLFIGLWQGLPVYGHGFIFPSTLCLLLSFIIGPLGIRRALRNYTATKNSANWSTLPVLVAGVVFSIVLAVRVWKEKPEASPTLSPLRFGFLSMYRRQGVTDLTNDFVLGIVGPTRLGALLVPVQAEDTNAVLMFGVINTNDATVEHVELSFACSKDSGFKFGPGWESGDDDFRPREDVNGQSRTITTPALLPHRGDFGSVIEVDFPSTNRFFRGSINLMAEAKGVPRNVASMELWIIRCPPNTFPKKPFVMLLNLTTRSFNFTSNDISVPRRTR